VKIDIVKHGPGWAEGHITTPLILFGDRVSIKVRDGHPSMGDNCTCSIIPNSNPRHAKWFAVRCRESIRESKSLVRDWEQWQVGEKALILDLLSTRPGSDHCGITFACWKCGKDVLESNQINRIKNSSVWTTNISAGAIGVVLDPKQDYNDIKKCAVQNVRCSCNHVLGSYYKDKYADADEDKEFPCFKFITAWERKKWNGDIPSMALVLTGNREHVIESIASLEVSDDWLLDKQFQCGGRVDKSTYALVEKAKKLQLEKEEAEERARLAEMAAATKAVDQIQALADKEKEIEERERRVLGAESIADAIDNLERRAREAESLAAAKIAEATESVKRVKEVKPERNNRRVIWECNVDGCWTPYPSQVNASIEKSMSNGSSKANFSLHGHQYEVELAPSGSRMFQRNISTNVRRPVQRREESEDSTLGETKVPIPRTWSRNAPGQNLELVALTEGSAEWRATETKLKETLPSAKLKRLVRVQNLSLWEYYRFREDQTKKLSRGKGANVVHVWHGTRENDPMVICRDGKDGFMMQQSRAGMWGNGIYFASKASYSDSYAYEEQEQQGGLSSLFKQNRGLSSIFTMITTHRTLILSRLVVGDEIDLPSDKTLRHPPKKPDGNGRYDTVTGLTSGSKVYIVYENGRAYPEYLVTYTSTTQE